MDSTFQSVPTNGTDAWCAGGLEGRCPWLGLALDRFPRTGVRATGDVVGLAYTVGVGRDVDVDAELDVVFPEVRCGHSPAQRAPISVQRRAHRQSTQTRHTDTAHRHIHGHSTRAQHTATAHSTQPQHTATAHSHITHHTAHSTQTQTQTQTQTDTATPPNAHRSACAIEQRNTDHKVYHTLRAR